MSLVLIKIFIYIVYNIMETIKLPLEYFISETTEKDYQLTSFYNKYTPNRPTFDTICKDLFNNKNIYNEIALDEIKMIPLDYEVNKSQCHFSNKILDFIDSKISNNSKVIVEVGSYVGSSACFLGEYVKKDNGLLICIDTWCGCLIMWLMDNYFVNQMDKSDGNPKIFYHFINTIKKHNLQDHVVPIRISSISGCRMLKVLKYEIDVIYLDGSHENGETFMELCMYYDLLKMNGIIFGDDYKVFPAVKKNVDKFVEIFKLELLFPDNDDTWVIIKNKNLT